MDILQHLLFKNYYCIFSITIQSPFTPLSPHTVVHGHESFFLFA